MACFWSWRAFTSTRPDLFRVLNRQSGSLSKPRRGGGWGIVEPIPIHCLSPNINLAASFLFANNRRATALSDLGAMDDAIVDGTAVGSRSAGASSFVRAARIGIIHRLYHYTGTDPEYFQNFVIFTNYQFYVDTFTLMLSRRWRW
jgi:AMP nucleosidase